MKNQQGLRGAHRLFICQLSVVFIAIVAALFTDNKAVLSAFLGGLISAVPTLLFARKMFRHQGARAAKQIVNAFYQGEALKIGLSIILFTLVFALLPIKPLWFFATYIVVQMVYWFSPLIFNS